MHLILTFGSKDPRDLFKTLSSLDLPKPRNNKSKPRDLQNKTKIKIQVT
jgi:hypothetical protein